MNIAVTFPGKIGDLLWALPTVRAISRTNDCAVTIFVSQYLSPLAPLLDMQPYILKAIVLSHWQVEFGAPVTPRIPEGTTGPNMHAVFDKVLHLGHEGWPMSPLPMETLNIGAMQTKIDAGTWSIHEPWITVNKDFPEIDVAVGFTQEHFELKYGLWSLLTNTRMGPRDHFPASRYFDRPLRWQSISGNEDSRWHTEGGHKAGGWVEAASVIKAAKVFLGCCSALHVLSAAMGKPTVVMEPNPHRHHPIFWPYASTGDRVHPVIGGDGQMTFDARHTAETLKRFL